MTPLVEDYVMKLILLFLPLASRHFIDLSSHPLFDNGTCYHYRHVTLYLDRTLLVKSGSDSGHWSLRHFTPTVQKQAMHFTPGFVLVFQHFMHTSFKYAITLHPAHHAPADTTTKTPHTSYILCCPLHNDHRMTLFAEIVTILPQFHELSNRDKLNTLLYGTNVSKPQQASIASMFQTFIVRTQRFHFPL